MTSRKGGSPRSTCPGNWMACFSLIPSLPAGKQASGTSLSKGALRLSNCLTKKTATKNEIDSSQEKGSGKRQAVSTGQVSCPFQSCSDPGVHHFSLWVYLSESQGYTAEEKRTICSYCRREPQSPGLFPIHRTYTDSRWGNPP